MIEWIKLKFNLKKDFSNIVEYERCIYDLIQHKMVRKMSDFLQHGDVNCLEHSLYVSYSSYKICRKLGLDFRAAARGGLLHDFFLYDWHSEKPYKGLHGFTHPHIALKNANKYFDLNDKEKDIILNHMWPLTLRLPRCKETYIVLLADKYCAAMESIKFDNIKTINRLKKLFAI